MAGINLHFKRHCTLTSSFADKNFYERDSMTSTGQTPRPKTK